MVRVYGILMLNIIFSITVIYASNIDSLKTAAKNANTKEQIVVYNQIAKHY